MSSSKLTKLLLIIGPVMMVVGFAGWGVILGDTDFNDTAAAVKALGENVSAIKPFALLGTIGLLLTFAGIGGVRNSMDGGPGNPIAGLGLLLMGIGLAGGVAEAGLTLGSGDASSKAAQAAAAGAADSAVSAGAVATSLFAASQSIGAAFTALGFLGYAIIGGGILIQKNFHTVIGALIVVTGVIGAVVASVDYQNILMIIPYIAFPILALAMGVITIRSNTE